LGNRRGRLISTPDRRATVELIEQAMAAGASQTKACEALGLSARTYQRWTRAGGVETDGRPEAKRPVPANKLSDAERARIIETCNRPAYASRPPSQIVPALADRGEYMASESSFYRVLRDADQGHHRGRAQAPRPVEKPQPHRADGPNQVWSWDITYLASTVLGMFFRLYLVMDIYSRKIVGWEVHSTESAEQAATLIEKACWAERIRRNRLVLHADNGSPMKGATMLAKLQKLGIMPSFSRPSVSNDNPYSESLFGTMKYSPAYPSKPFDSLEEAQAWVHEFVRWYNGEHRHSGLKFVTPNERHQGTDATVLERRKAVYEEAKRRHPERWSGSTRNWDPIRTVWLNPSHAGLNENAAELRKAA
jgi:transposase InsO family protein